MISGHKGVFSSSSERDLDNYGSPLIPFFHGKKMILIGPFQKQLLFLSSSFLFCQRRCWIYKKKSQYGQLGNVLQQRLQCGLDVIRLEGFLVRLSISFIVLSITEIHTGLKELKT